MSSPLFHPIVIGQASLHHRVVMAPLTRLRADESHVPQAMAKTYYEQRASEKGTLIISEATLVSAATGGSSNSPGLFTSEQIQGWKNVTDAVHAKGSYIFAQLMAMGRAADAATLQRQGGFEVFAPSAIPINEADPLPKVLSEQQILDIIDEYKIAAKNAIEAGFDGVEVHGANGYLVDQFLHDGSNTRTDRWGGSIENRARFAVEVAKALVETVGADRVGFRISPWNEWQSMQMADPIPQFSYLVSQLKQLDLAYLHVVESRVFNNVDCEGRGEIKAFLEQWGQEKPVLIAGGFNPDNVNGAMEEKYRDYNVAIVFGRHFLANPDLPFRLRNGVPLQKYDRSTFYAKMTPSGYIDYPFSSEFTAATTA
ncbi:hypothetical protein PWT90_03002 [Aphanocladium album]|nr:hypothetical protein PWT90_03002 [Aphanocladium album]